LRVGCSWAARSGWSTARDRQRGTPRPGLGPLARGGFAQRSFVSLRAIALRRSLPDTPGPQRSRSASGGGRPPCTRPASSRASEHGWRRRTGASHRRDDTGTCPRRGRTGSPPAARSTGCRREAGRAHAHSAQRPVASGRSSLLPPPPVARGRDFRDCNPLDHLAVNALPLQVSVSRHRRRNALVLAERAESRSARVVEKLVGAGSASIRGWSL
jgi:hypothetical protein